MSYGLTPYDKKSYKESKRRRKQALKADKTGKIKPYGTARKKAKIISVIVAIALIAVAICCIYSLNNKKEASDDTAHTATIGQEDLLIMVNRQNPLEKDFVPELSELNGVLVNSIAYNDTLQLLKKAEQEGIELKIKSAYISFEEQSVLYNNKLEEFLLNPDYTKVRAEAIAQKYMPQAGCSEAQTGLLIDFDIADTNTKAFVERNCINFGFILRYPQDKEDVTHIYPSETAYRYVGKDNAIKMRSFGMCLEEYNEYLDLQTI